MSLSAQYKDGELVRDASDRTFRYEEKTGLFTNINGKPNVRYAYNPTTQVMTELPESVTSQPMLIERKTGFKAELVAKWYLTKHKVKSVLSGTVAILDFFKKNKGFKDGDVIYYIDDRVYVFEERTGFFKKTTGKDGERYAYDPYTGSMTQIPWKYSEPEKAKTYKNNKLDIDIFHANNMWDEDLSIGQFSLKEKRILFINDEPEKLNEYLELFNIDGVILEGATSYDDFVKRFSENKYDFIFTDMNLGWNFLSFSGMDVVRTVRRYNTKVPVIVITTVTGESIGNIWNAGFTGSYVITSNSKTWERATFRAKCAVWSSAANLFYNIDGKPVDILEVNIASLETELKKYLAEKENVEISKFDNLKIDGLINITLAKMIGSNRLQFDFDDWFLLSTTDLFSFIKNEASTSTKRNYDLFLLSGMIMDQYIYSKERPEPIEYIDPFIKNVRDSYKENELSTVDLVAVKKHFSSLYGKNDMVFDLISRGVLYEMPLSDGSEKPFVSSEKWREKYIPAIEVAYASLEFYLAKAKESKRFKQFNIDRCNVLVKRIDSYVSILDQDENSKYSSVCYEWLTKIEAVEKELDKLSPGRTHVARPTYQKELSGLEKDIKTLQNVKAVGGMETSVVETKPTSKEVISVDLNKYEESTNDELTRDAIERFLTKNFADDAEITEKMKETKSTEELLKLSLFAFAKAQTDESIELEKMQKIELSFISLFLQPNTAKILDKISYSDITTNDFLLVDTKKIIESAKIFADALDKVYEVKTNKITESPKYDLADPEVLKELRRNNPDFDKAYDIFKIDCRSVIDAGKK